MTLRFPFYIICFTLLEALRLSAGESQAQLIPADPEAGFRFPYVLSIPPGIVTGEPTYIVVETNNTGARDSFEETLEESMGQASGQGLGPMISRYMNLPLVMPVFPRTKENWQLYTHALDSDTIHIDEGPLKRLDLQLIAMVEDAQKRLSETDYKPMESFVICGFSASGSFSNRFAFLHPERLVAVVSGGINSFPMLPVEQIGEKAFAFPLGVADIQSITEEPFKRETWRRLPQMIFMGALDDNDAVAYDDAYSEEQRSLIHEFVGEEMHDRWLKAQSHYLAAEANVNFITYGSIGHWTTRQVGMNIISFLEESFAEAK